MVTTKRDTLDKFWSGETETVKGTLTMVKRLGKVAGYELVLETWLTPMVTYPLVYEVGFFWR